MLTVQTAGGEPQYTGPEELAVEANASWAAVTTTGWQDNGCHISRYSVAYRKASQSIWVIGRIYTIYICIYIHTIYIYIQYKYIQ